MPKIVDHEQRRQDLIESAAVVIAEQGLEKTTMKDIAQAAGFSANLVAHYFANKDELLWNVQRFVGGRAAKRFLNSQDQSLYTLIESVLPYSTDTIVEWKVRTFFWSRAINDPAIIDNQEQLMKQVRMDMARVVRDQQALGRVKKEIDIDMTVERVFVLANAISLQILLEPKKYTKRFSRQLIASAIADLIRD